MIAALSLLVEVSYIKLLWHARSAFSSCWPGVAVPPIHRVRLRTVHRVVVTPKMSAKPARQIQRVEAEAPSVLRVARRRRALWGVVLSRAQAVVREVEAAWHHGWW